MIKFLNKLQNILDLTRHADFLGPLSVRLYLAPINRVGLLAVTG
jgi:hypothetical protein